MSPSIPHAQIGNWILSKAEEETNGRLKIEYFFSGEHPYKYGEIEKAGKRNEAQIIISTYGSMGGNEPGFDFNYLPGLFPSHTVATAAIIRADKEVMMPILRDKWNLIRVHPPMLYPYLQLETKKPAVEEGSLVGQRIRVSNKPANALVEALGGEPVFMGFGEVYSALQTGLVDGSVVSVDALYHAKWYEGGLSYVNLWDAIIGAATTYANRDALAELPDDLQKYVLDALGQINVLATARSAEYTGYALYGKWSDVLNLGILRPSPEYRAKVIDSLRTSYWEPAVKESGSTGQKIFEIFQETIDEMTSDVREPS